MKIKVWKGVLRITSLGILLTGATPSAEAQSPPVRVALTGTAAPAGGTYNGFSTNIALNDAGQVAFLANLTSGSATSGIFVGAPGSVQSVALQGIAAPAGGTFSSFNAPAINSAGQAGFFASLVGGSASSGLFVGTPGSVQSVAVQGIAAPAGGTYSGFNTTPGLNSSGQLAFRANLVLGSASAGVFVGAPGSVQTAALQGTAAPAGGNYSSLGITPAFNGSGQTAFQTSLSGGSSIQGIFSGTPGSIQTVALQGGAASGGGNYSSLNTNVALNSAGQSAFQAFISGSGSASGIFVGAPGSVQAVARQGAAAPSGGNYSSFNSPSLNSAGQTAFSANLSSGSATSGVFMGAPGSVVTVALQGGSAPGGGTFSSFDTTVAINNAGQTAFFAFLTGGGVTPQNDSGLYATSAGTLVKIVREGDQVDVDPTAGIDLRTVSFIGFVPPALGGADGRTTFNNSGQLTYMLAFTDNSSGVFVSSVAVPEPATYGLLAFAGLAGAGLVWAARKRRLQNLDRLVPAPCDEISES